MENIFDGAAIVCIYLGPLLLVLGIGGIISDVILPRCPRLLRLLEWCLHVDLGGNDYEED